MCLLAKPGLILFIIVGGASNILLTVYINLFYTMGPFNYNQCLAYFLFFVHNGILIPSCFVSAFSLLNNWTHWINVWVGRYGLMLSLFLGLLSSVKFIEAPSVSSMQEFFHYYYGHSGHPPPFLDAVQIEMNNCCGIESYEDYSRFPMKIDKLSVPDSCCIVFNPGCGMNIFRLHADQIVKKIHSKGCFKNGVNIKELNPSLQLLFKAIYGLPISSCIIIILLLYIYNYYYKRLPPKDPTHIA